MAEPASLHLWDRQAVQGTLLAHGFAVQMPAEPAARPPPAAPVLFPGQGGSFPRNPTKKQAENTFLLASGAYLGLTLHNHSLFLFSPFMR